MRHCHYLLDRLENHRKEVIDTSNFTSKHVMPQNDDLRSEWETMLGKNWESVRETWLHRLGNLTLTADNTEYSDRPFAEKKTIKGGFNDSPLRLNKSVREQDRWTAAEMERRGKDLAAKALTIWRPLVVDAEAVKTAELEDLKAQAARYSLEQLDFEKSKPLAYTDTNSDDRLVQKTLADYLHNTLGCDNAGGFSVVGPIAAVVLSRSR